MQSRGETEGLWEIVAQFRSEPVEQIQPLGQGHIHQTYLVCAAGGAQRWVLQRLNTHVFPNLAAVMENLVRVTDHLRGRLARGGDTDIDRRVLRVCRTHAGEALCVDAARGVFRMFAYVDGSLTLQQLASSRDGFEAGRICGEFAWLLRDLSPAQLHVTLPHFHATDRRFEALRDALAADPVGRAQQVAREWHAIAALEPLARECASWACDPQLRLRITHNDTKLNNILFDVTTRRALCLIDLDTVMPGYLAYDFGDLVRSCLCTVDEDARDPSAADVHVDLFEPLVRGYLSGVGSDLTPLERRSLARGPLWIVLELALRFLTDYVQGDHYFKTARPDHNLDRGRVMLALLSRLRELEVELQRVIDRCTSEAT